MGRAAPATRAHEPPPPSPTARLGRLCCCAVFFVQSRSSVRVPSKRYAQHQAKTQLTFVKMPNPKNSTQTHAESCDAEIREKRNTPLQSYTEAVWLRASRSKGFAKTSVSARSRNVATSRATAGGERLATCSGCSCRSSSIVSIGLSRVAGSQSARVAWGAWLISALSMACHNWCLPCTRWLSTE